MSPPVVMLALVMNWETYFAQFDPDTAPSFGAASVVASQEIPHRMTPLDPEEATKAIAAGYKLVTGKAPSKDVLRLLVGQWALETGNGKSVHNYNFGNKKASSGDQYHQFFRCWELVNGQKVWYDPPSPVCKFAAYKSAAEGAAAYIELLKRRDHWWKGLHTGTTAGFVKGLTTKPAYFTDNPSTYAKGLDARAALYADFIGKYAYKLGPQIVMGLAISAGLYYGYRRYGQTVVRPALEAATERVSESIDHLKDKVNS